MIVAFCGHSNYIEADDDKKRVLDLLETSIKDSSVEFFLGEYGAFDNFAYNCCKIYKKKHPNAKLIFITPYLSTTFQKNNLTHKEHEFDSIVYPPLENAPLKFAISYRNKWIVDQADIIITYITHKYGGAYSTYRYAKQKNKKIFNIFD